MIQESIYKTVENATVTILGSHGQGVLVNGNLIVTAAHCIDFKVDASMVLGDFFIEKIKVGDRELKVAPVAVEPVSDIAVLGSLDDQSFYKEALNFERFCEDTKPVPLCRNDFELFQEFKVYIHIPQKGWVTAKAMQCSKDAYSLSINSDKYIEGGASGGPIINDSGEIVGIVSNFSENKIRGKFNGSCPRPHLALPVWVRNRIIGN